MIGDKRFLIENLGKADLLNEWGRKFDIQDLQALLPEFRSLEDMQSFDVDSLDVSPEVKMKFKAAKSEIVVAFLSNQQPSKY